MGDLIGVEVAWGGKEQKTSCFLILGFCFNDMNVNGTNGEQTKKHHCREFQSFEKKGAMFDV